MAKAIELAGSKQKAPYSQGNINLHDKAEVEKADRKRFEFVNGFLVYQIGTLITTGSPGAGFAGGLIAVIAFAVVIVGLIVKANKQIGVSEKTAEKDACMIEHVISEETYCKIKDYIGFSGIMQERFRKDKICAIKYCEDINKYLAWRYRAKLRLKFTVQAETVHNQLTLNM